MLGLVPEAPVLCVYIKHTRGRKAKLFVALAEADRNKPPNDCSVGYRLAAFCCWARLCCVAPLTYMYHAA